MISYSEALDLLLLHSLPLGKCRMPLERSSGCFLSRAIATREPIPRFDQSAMDGYGVRWETIRDARRDAPVRLPVADMVQAGAPARRRLLKGAAVRIFTGGQIPPGVDTVVIQEWCEAVDGEVNIFQSPQKGENIRWRGEEYPRGESVLPAGTRITPPVVGLLATLGCTDVPVYEKPRVGLIVTGDELVLPGERPGPGQIRDSNSFGLCAALRQLGLDRIAVRRVRDDRRSMARAFAEVLKRTDFLLTAGGISVGEYDFVKDVAEALGIETVFWKVAIKPGMPNYLGTLAAKKRKGGKKLIFGMPGNPVSALISYHQFIKPALLKILGHPDPLPFRTTALLDRPFRKKAGRLQFVRAAARAEGGRIFARPLNRQDSHMLGGFLGSNCIMCVPADTTAMREGDPVAIEMIDWGGFIE